ncbi:glycosyltransferase family 2 protein [Alteromonas stellipolaris]|uniref:glycosyltransferase family 2 protein n=1 Tax=Alteromonas stellipolaris TaxID=233316 RepID=UPI0021194490|nr:glycosyltransferase family 2 protein [Alteromonas stellipolaris]MCQ8850419.1 glycosyltransferase family 2 protein [Alteromonas stellipolaris]
MLSKVLKPANLKRLAYRLAKKLIIVPHHQLNEVTLESSGSSWISTGDDPQFIIHPARRIPTRTFKKGWYLLRIKLTEANHQSHVGKLYSNLQKGELITVDVPWHSTKFVNRLFYLENANAMLRFDPCETETEFTINTFMISKLPTFIAMRHMKQRLYKLLNHVDNVEEYLATNCKLSGGKYIDTIYDEYNKTFTTGAMEKSYPFWIKFDEPRAIQKMKQTFTENQAEVKFSIILPTYNTDPIYLKECIDSVINQSHSNWELCIADDASTSVATTDVLKSYKQQYPNIKVKLLSKNGHISKASNEALSMVTSDYVLLLDHDDTLPAHTLSFFAKAISDNASAQVLYADEDKIDEQGARHQPHFKPDWNPDLLLSQNYICHPAVYKTSLLKKIGGFRVGVEGSQDHDLLLRATANLSREEVVHLPFILYHWRVIENSTASNASAKSYTTDAGIEALKYFLSQSKQNASVEKGKYPNTYKINWSLPTEQPLVSLIIPTRDGYDILKQCLESIYDKTTYDNFEIIVVDNQTSCEKTLGLFNDYSDAKNNFSVLKWDKPFNYSAINNFAVSQAKGEVVGLVNNDIEVINGDWLTEMVSHALRPEIGCVGAKLYYPNDTIQHAGVVLGIGGVAGHSHKYFHKSEPGYFTRLHLVQNMSAVTAACLVVRKSVFEEVGGLNEKDLTVAFNDVDFCLKVHTAGYRNLFTPWAELYHHESISRGEEDTPEKIQRFNKESTYMKEQWGDLLKADPAYNKNLSSKHENFSLE